MALILVTGAEGQLGSEIKDLSTQFTQHEFLFTDVDRLDITSLPSLKKAFNNNKIDFVINCAAYTSVDKAEEEKRIVDKVNITGIANISKLCANYQTKLIHISTDYVFDGISNKPYNEDSPVNPLSIYGQSKLKGEIEAIRHIQTIIFRTSWLYSSFGNNFLKTIMKLGQEKKELGIVFDQTSTPTYARDLAQAILDIIDNSDQDSKYFVPGIYHYSNEGVCSWFDFAREIKFQMDFPCVIHPITSDKYPTRATRPPYSVLDKTKFKETFKLEIPYWRFSLVKCINKILK